MGSSFDVDDDRDDRDRGPRARPPGFPASVRAAGVLWIVFGGIGLLGVFLSFGVLVASAGRATGPNFCGVLIPVVFLIVGIQTVSGSINSMVGPAVASLVFGCIYLGLGALVAVLGVGALADARHIEPAILVIAAMILVGLGILLVTAGTLALVGKDRYFLWKRGWRRRWRDFERDEEEERRRWRSRRDRDEYDRDDRDDRDDREDRDDRPRKRYPDDDDRISPGDKDR
jgi:hypothetical protein